MNETHKESSASFECTNTGIGVMIGQYEMGTLSEAEQVRFEEHLLDCAHCRREVELMYPIASALAENRDAVLSALKQEGVTFESTSSKLQERVSANARVVAARKPKARVVYWGVSVAVVAAAVIFIIGRMGIDSGGKYDPFIKFLPMDNPTPLLLRGTSGPIGQENYMNGVNAYVEADYKRAERYFSKAVSQSPEQGDWWLILGVCQFLRHDAKNAISSLTEADKLTEGTSRQKARWFLSQSYLMVEDVDAAVKLLEWLVTEGKDHSQDARKLLEELRNSNVLGDAFRDGPQLISPQGGEIFVFGSPITFAWREPEPDFTGTYEVWLSKNGGLSCSKCLASELPADELTWTWDIPGETGDHLAVRIEAIDGQSRRLGPVTPEFIISQPLSLMLWDPNFETTLYQGFSHEVHWAFPAQKPRYYRLELWSAESGDPSYYRTLNSQINGDRSSWVWENPGPVGEDYLLRLEAVFTDSSVEDFCDEAFSISEKPKISFNQAEFNGQDLSLQLNWTHTIEKSMRQTLYLKSLDNAQVIPLSNSLNRNRRRWEGELSGLPEGNYEIFLTVVFPDGNLSGKVEEPIYLSGIANKSRSTEQAGSAIEAADIYLKQNYPNPFNTSTTIEFELTQADVVDLKIYNMMGQEVKTLISGRTEAGLHRIQFNAEGLASGTYIFRLTAGSKTDQKQMVLVK
jgi:tetratricopeptide (TPR) repeat protein